MIPPPVNRATQIVTTVASVIIVPLVFIGGLLLARANIRRGRGDRRGAIRLGIIAFVLSMGQWALGSSHFADVAAEQSRFGAALAAALMTGAQFALLYLAIEPHVRRLWPHLLVTWSRLVSGRLRDPLFGRDMVIGALTGVTMSVITFGHYALPEWFGWAEFAPPNTTVAVLAGTGAYWALVLGLLSAAIGNAMIGGVGLTLFRLVIPSQRTVLIVASLFFSFLAARGQIETGSVLLDLALGILLVIPVLWTIVRFGFVAGTVSFLVHFLTKDMPMTLDPSRLYFSESLTTAMLVVVIACAGFVLARAREPIFGAVIQGE